MDRRLHLVHRFLLKCRKCIWSDSHKNAHLPIYLIKSSPNWPQIFRQRNVNIRKKINKNKIKLEIIFRQNFIKMKRCHPIISLSKRSLQTKVSRIDGEKVRIRSKQPWISTIGLEVHAQLSVQISSLLDNMTVFGFFSHIFISDQDQIIFSCFGSIWRICEQPS